MNADKKTEGKTFNISFERENKPFCVKFLNV